MSILTHTDYYIRNFPSCVHHLKLTKGKKLQEGVGPSSSRSCQELECQSRLLFLLSADNGGKMFSTCGHGGAGWGSIAEALISAGIVWINGSHCHQRCLFLKVRGCSDC